jgi:hypothetical protein
MLGLAATNDSLTAKPAFLRRQSISPTASAFQVSV